MPVRITRSRKKGYKTPPGSRYVGRPTKWGNPFKAGGPGSDGGGSDMIYGDASYRRKIFDPWIFIETCHPDRIRDRVIELYKQWLNGENPWFINPCTLTSQQIKDELKGLDLSCWCPEDKKCHADILLEIANK